jgi:hypothetical protein
MHPLFGTTVHTTVRNTSRNASRDTFRNAAHLAAPSYFWWHTAETLPTAACTCLTSAACSPQRNYHIFYMLCKAEAEIRAPCSIDSWEAYRACKQAGTVAEVSPILGRLR